MEAVQKRPQRGGFKHFASTRRGAYTIAAVSAALAGLILLMFVNNYKDNVDAGLAPAPVLTADRLIPAGTAGNEVLAQKLFRATAVADKEVKPGAVTNSANLAGTVATRDILPGEQITAADFVAGADPIRSRLTGTERAVQIPIDQVHGLLGTLRAGDRVDVLAAFNSQNNTDGSGTPTLRPLMRGVRIMAIASGSVILESTDRQGAALAFAADNAQLWFLLRPPVGATDSKSTTVTEDELATSKELVAPGAHSEEKGSR